jgi:hypothetical protein
MLRGNVAVSSGVEKVICIRVQREMLNIEVFLILKGAING